MADPVVAEGFDERGIHNPFDIGAGRVMCAETLNEGVTAPEEIRRRVFWISNTIRKVTIVVPVLMTSCQVSE